MNAAETKSRKCREATFKAEKVKEDQDMEGLISHNEEFGLFFLRGIKLRKVIKIGSHIIRR